MAAISDSSPLILYARIGRLDLLHDVFGEMLIPRAVWDEVVTQGGGRQGAAIGVPRWIGVHNVQRGALSRGGLDPGEAEAIALALEFGRTLPLILDDKKGRRIAKRVGLPVIGSAGVLLLAKERRLISETRPLLDQLADSGLYLNNAVAASLLDLAKE